MIKINSLELENVKRIKAVKLSPSENGLTIIGGKNNQGKTSVLDSIAWALGGDRYRPSASHRDGSVIPPHLHVVLSNGLIADRAGKNSNLKVTDPNGVKGGQQILNEFIEELALNLPKFMESSDKEKANSLLKIIGVGDTLTTLEREEIEIYNKRRAVGQLADQKLKYAKEMKSWDNVPDTVISAADLISQQQEILAKNGENQRKRSEVARLEAEEAHLKNTVESLTARLNGVQEELATVQADLITARKSAEELHDESTAELEENIRNIDILNAKIRDNLNKDKAMDDAREYSRQYEELTTALEQTRQSKRALLNNADLPLPELSVENGCLTYKGKEWDSISGSDQLKVATAIVRKLNPNCGFVLIDKLEQMDLETLKEFGEWLEKENLQAIATRVSTGDECSVIIEDGYSIEPDETPIRTKQWKAGVF